MSEETVIKDHWALDFPMTEHSDKNEYVSFIEDVVSGDLKLINDKNSDILIFDQSDSRKNDFEFELFAIPEYSKTFAIQKRKYTAKTQKWIGYVIDIKENSFIAHLEELNDSTTYEIGEFDKFEILPDDLPLLSIGSTFYWSIGYLTNNSQRKKESTIKFRRLGNLSVEDFDRIKDKADNLFESINWEK